MLRGENVVCGTSTAGTGTLTLAACPTPPGGADFYQWLTATGLGFANGNAVLVSYCLVEYTDSTFTTAKQQEKGIGTLTLGASLTASTLARTTLQQTATGESATATYAVGSPSAINIGTAASTLIFVGASATDIPAYPPYFETSLGDAAGVPPVAGAITGTAASANLVSAQDYYWVFEWRTPMPAKSCTMRVATAYSGGSPVSNADARLYAIGANGRPGKLLCDFGLFGAAGTSLNATGNIKATAADAFFMTPGLYILDFLPVFSGGVTLPQMQIIGSNALLTTGIFGTTSLGTNNRAMATGGVIGTAPDPANVAGYAVSTVQQVFSFTLNSS